LTQAPTDGDLLSILIDDALTGHDPHTVCSLYTAPVGADPFALESNQVGKSSARRFSKSRGSLANGRKRTRMSAREVAYRNLVLNQRIEASSPFVMPAQWQACARAPLDLKGRDVFRRIGLERNARFDRALFGLM
jgi:hypothetical protein